MLSKNKITMKSKLTPEIAELIGIIIGDGCIRYKLALNQYYIEIVGNRFEEIEYFNYIKKLVKKELKLNCFIKIRERGIRLKIYSKKFVEFLINDLGLPYNKFKGENIFIPDKIINDLNLLKICLRGIVDTDGSLFLSNKSHRTNYPTIEISTTSKRLALQLRKILSKNFRIGFRNYKREGFRIIYVISLNGEKMVDKWVKEIGFSNNRNLRRYEKLKGGDAGI